MSFLPIVNNNDIDADKNLSRSDRDSLIQQINSTDPHYIFKEAGETRNRDKRKIICPNCANGSGDDATRQKKRLALSLFQRLRSRR